MKTMTRVAGLIAVLALSPHLEAQQPQPHRPPRFSPTATGAENAVKNAMQQFAQEKKAFERDIEVLRQLRLADDALVDPMQPATALQKAHEHAARAKDLAVEFAVKQGVIKAEQEIASAKRSPGMADFARLRSVLRTEAIGPASRLVARNALRLEEDILAWLKVQESIAQHLRSLSDVAGESLRAAIQ